MPLFTPELEFSDDYPTIEPSLKLDFANSRALDPRITFERASVATYVGRDGLLKTAGENEARFDHDPVTLESLGLLIEESRTNNISQSNASNWSNTNVTRGTNTAQDVSPEGLNTATIITETTGDGLHRIKSPNISFSDTRTFSVWIKRNSGTRDLYINANAIMGAGLNFDFDTETLGSTTGTASFERYPNQWYRFILTGTGTGNTNGVYIQFAQSGNEGDDYYIGATSNKFLVWGAQLEVGSFVTSHIPTSGASATRSTDVARILNESFNSFYNSTEHSLLVDYVLDKNAQLKSPLGVNAVRFCDAGPGSFNGVNGYQIRVVTDLTSPQIDAHGNYDFLTHFDSAGINLSDGVNEYKVAMGFALNDQSFVSGSVVQTDTDVPLPNPQTVLIERLVIGELPTKAHYKKIVYYSKRLTNTQLQTLTQ